METGQTGSRLSMLTISVATVTDELPRRSSFTSARWTAACHLSKVLLTDTHVPLGHVSQSLRTLYGDERQRDTHDGDKNTWSIMVTVRVPEREHGIDIDVLYSIHIIYIQ